MTATMMQRATNPPITPPTIAPTLASDSSSGPGDGLGVGGADSSQNRPVYSGVQVQM